MDEGDAGPTDAHPCCLGWHAHTPQCHALLQEIDPTPDEGDTDGLGGESGSFLGELAGAIPGIDEAMSFAEVMRQVRPNNPADLLGLDGP